MAVTTAKHPNGTKKKPSSTNPSRRTVILVVGVALALTAALIAVALAMRGGSSPTPSNSPAIDFSGIPQQGAVLGSPKAKVKLIEYADVQCPACQYYSLNLLPTVVDEYVRPGKVATEYRGYPFIGDDSIKGERFLLAAAEQNKMWQLMEAFYRNQGAENSGWLTDDLIRKLAAGIPGLNVDKLFARAQSAELGSAAQQAAATGQSAGVRGTPTLLVAIGNQTPYEISVGTPDQVRQALDDALKG
jgi:protein-disulfide isomerase